MPEVSRVAAHSAGAGQDREFHAGIGHDLGDLRALGDGGEAERAVGEPDDRAAEVGRGGVETVIAVEARAVEPVFKRGVV